MYCLVFFIASLVYVSISRKTRSNTNCNCTELKIIPPIFQQHKKINHKIGFSAIYSIKLLVNELVNFN